MHLSTANNCWVRHIVSDLKKILLLSFVRLPYQTTVFERTICPIVAKKKIERRIPYAKQMRRYPGVLIGRLGINIQFKHQGIGTELMTFIKSWFLDSANKTGCRFLIVDAYNESIPIDYYLKNGFKFLFSTEEQEAKYTNINILPIRTRLMYFDLMELI
jgi:hypothetical protein